MENELFKGHRLGEPVDMTDQDSATAQLRRQCCRCLEWFHVEFLKLHLDLVKDCDG